jgi:hypothetical protein
MSSTFQRLVIPAMELGVQIMIRTGGILILARWECLGTNDEDR